MMARETLDLLDSCTSDLCLFISQLGLDCPGHSPCPDVMGGTDVANYGKDVRPNTGKRTP